MAQRNDTNKKVKIHVMGEEEVFSFNEQDWEQALVENTGEVDIVLKDEDDTEFVLRPQGIWSASTLPSKALSGLSVETPAGGACQIIYVQ